MKSVLLCGEGHHDVGAKEWDKKTGDHVWHEGWMQPLVRKASSSEIKFKIRYLKELFLSPNPKALRPSLKGQGDKAAFARLIAKIEGCDAVVYMTDADTNIATERQLKLNEINEGFNAIANGVSCIACVPMSTSESWLLSDVSSWQSLGLGEQGNFPRQCPETLWGARNDPMGNHPKHVFARVANDAQLPDNRETRTQVCELSSLDAMESRCPDSLGQFTKDILDALGADKPKT